jgi:hypothetical protein
MRVKFEIDIDNNVTILDADQEENTITVKQDGDKKVILVSTPDNTMEDLSKLDMFINEEDNP